MRDGDRPTSGAVEMARRADPKERSHQPLFRRLDRAAENVNPILIVLIARLAVLYMALQLARLPVH
jgi:hypothetical protein